jgi:pilus assembly protein Flp/PilA
MEIIMLNNIKQVMTDDQGATMVEYGLIVALIAVFCIVAVKGLGTAVSGGFTTAGNQITTAVG